MLAAAGSVLSLAACSTQDAAVAQNEAAQPEMNLSEGEVSPDAAPLNGSEEPGAETVPPPDAVSHPDGYLPVNPGNAALPPAPGNPTPAAEPPATEDEYIRDKQKGA